LILSRIIKIVGTRCHILSLKCTKFDFGCGSVPDSAGRADSAPPSLNWIQGQRVLLLRGREGKGRAKGRGEKERRGGIIVAAPSTHSWRRLCTHAVLTEFWR